MKSFYVVWVNGFWFQVLFANLIGARKWEDWAFEKAQRVEERINERWPG